MKQLFSHRRPLELTIHIVSWLLIFGFPLVFMDRGSGFSLPQFLRHSCVPLCYFFIFYINYLWLVPRFLFTDEIRKYILSNVVLIFCMGVLLQIFLESMSAPPPPEFVRRVPPRWIFVVRDIGMMVFVAGLGAAIRTSLRWRQAEELLIESEKQKTEAELKNLKNQLNPHFLLNTLNNIYALIAFNSDRAQEAVQELSKLLRHVLYDNQETFVPLEKELDFIRNYVSLMRIRLSQQVEVSVNLEADAGGALQIAPLLFISLIENAFKHGISPTANSFISISITGHADGTVKCEILNSNHPKSGQDKSGSGVGLEQVSKRLELIYPGHYEWIKGTSENGQVYSSILTIQTKGL
ncbi:sensor histidine kinase [Phocaeicola sp.]|jgi:two-component sensor histidine kinase